MRREGGGPVGGQVGYRVFQRGGCSVDNFIIYETAIASPRW